MTVLKLEDIKKSSLPELRKALTASKQEVVTLGVKLRAKQSHDRKTYLSNKKNVAQILTELRSRELTNESN